MKRVFLFSLMAIVLLITGCGGSKSANQSIDLITSTGWKLTYINNSPVKVSAYPNGVPVANFTQDHKISGNGGCNGYSGTYNINEENGINIGQIISTKMFCQGVAESDFFSALESANQIRVEKNKLILYNDNKEVLVFVPNE